MATHEATHDATDKADRRAVAGELLGLRPEDMKFGTGFAAYSQFARSVTGRVLYRGIWVAIGALAVGVFVAALLN